MAMVDTVQGLNRWIERCNNAAIDMCCPFVVNDRILGYIPPDFASLITKSDVFQERQWKECSSIQIAEKYQGEPARTEAVGSVLSTLSAEGHITGWREELYPVAASFGAPPSLLIERAAAHLFGIKAYGVHVNGFARRPDGLHLWVAKRAASKPTWPGKLDHLAAGGQPHGISVKENAIKEAEEEAGVDRSLAEKAVSAGAVSYVSRGPGGVGIKRDVLFVFDLELPDSFVPEARDGEVDTFELLPAEQVLETVAFTDDYKDNCNLVLIDFFIRHGLVPADAPGYLDLVRGLRSSECS